MRRSGNVLDERLLNREKNMKEEKENSGLRGLGGLLTERSGSEETSSATRSTIRDSFLMRSARGGGRTRQRRNQEGAFKT